MPWREISCAPSRLMSTPSKATLPLVDLYMPVMQLNIVVLPAPLGPISEVIEPGAMVKETVSSAVMPWKRISSEETSSSGAVIGSPSLHELRCHEPSERPGGSFG